MRYPGPVRARYALPCPARPCPSQPIPGFPPLPILLTNTLVPKNTRALVAGVRRLLEAHRAPTAATFDAIGAIAAEFVERAAGSAAAAAPAEGGILGDGGDGGGAEAGSLPLTAECVGELAEMNHRLLCALGVGHPALERVCEVSNAHGCKSKLTGAGESWSFCVSRDDWGGIDNALLKPLGKEGLAGAVLGVRREITVSSGS